MKNPRVTATQLRQSRALSLTLPSEIKDGVPTLGGELTGGKLPSALDSKKGSEGLEKFLQTLKFSEGEIETLTKFAATVAAVASVVGWVFAAISTGKAVLTLLGILGSGTDLVMTALQSIGKRLEQMYSYLAHQEKKGLYNEAIEYRGKISTIRTAIDDMALSRSDIAFSTLTIHIPFLQQTINAMLDPGRANIPFFREAYGYGTPNHWIDMATPFYMSRTDWMNRGVDYQDPSTDLGWEKSGIPGNTWTS